MEEAIVEELLLRYGFSDFKWLDPKTIVVEQWVRFKCMLMCKTFGTKLVCPPHMPSFEECTRFFSEYGSSVLIRLEKEAHHRDDDAEIFKSTDENLLELEKELYYQGLYKVMMLPHTICSLCPTCPDTVEECRNKQHSRPTPEALCVDVFATVRKAGYPIEVLSSYAQTMNRYAIILLE